MEKEGGGGGEIERGGEGGLPEVEVTSSIYIKLEAITFLIFRDLNTVGLNIVLANVNNIIAK